MKRQKTSWILPLTVFFLVIMSSFTNNSVDARTSSVPIVVDGQLDLRQQDIDTNSPLKLNGEWEFYWQQLLEPNDLESPMLKNKNELIQVPISWNNTEEKKYSKYGYGTYRLKIHVDENMQGKLVTLNIRNVATAYKIWVNGELLAMNGVVGKTREEMVAKNYSKLVTFEVEEPSIELLIQVSNFHQRKAGLWDTITIGSAEQMAEQRERAVIFQLFVVSGIFIVGFYHAVLFFAHRREKAAFYLSIVCLAVVVRTLLLKDTLLIKLFPQISWGVGVTLEYLAALVALFFFLVVIKHQMPEDVPPWLLRLLNTSLAVYGIFVLFAPVRIFTNSFFIFQALTVVVVLSIYLISIVGVKRKRKGALFNVVSMTVLLIAVLNDVFYYSSKISTDEFFSIGLFVYLFMQSIQLSRQYSRYFSNVEKMSQELYVLNQTLERKVDERTEELRGVNDSLQKMEQARRGLLANVSHELNTPLTFIQGYIKAMIDGVISRDDSTYLRTIYSDTQMMARIIQDLQDLSKLESGQASFQLELVEIQSFLKSLYEKEKLFIQEKGLQFYYKEEASVPMMCLLDAVRIKQVYMNLIINAKKFTSSGGMIGVEVEYLEKFVKISVHDSGRGIAEEDLPFIFDRFYKTDQTTHEEIRGAGLGLAIVKEIIEAHGGTIHVTSEKGKGSVFSFILPIQLLDEMGPDDE